MNKVGVLQTAKILCFRVKCTLPWEGTTWNPSAPRTLERQQSQVTSSLGSLGHLSHKFVPAKTSSKISRTARLVRSPVQWMYIGHGVLKGIYSRQALVLATWQSSAWNLLTRSERKSSRIRMVHGRIVVFSAGLHQKSQASRRRKALFCED